MKQSVYSPIGLVVLLLLTSSNGLTAAETPAPSKGTPIIFSPATSHNISSNLNELRVPRSPFQNLESELTRPFEALNDNSTPYANIRNTRKNLPPPPAQTKKTAKEKLNDQAEEMYLSPESIDASKAEEAFFQLSDGPDDPYKNKPRNSLERYYDHLDRNRQVTSNQPSATLFDEKGVLKTESLGFDNKFAKPAAYLSNDRDLPGATSSQVSNNISATLDRSTELNSSRLPNNSFTRSSSSDFGTAPRSAGESRMEDFKRLLEGNRYVAPTLEPNSLATPTVSFRDASTDSAFNPAPIATSSTSSPRAFDATPPKTKLEQRQEFSKSAGLVGDPGKIQSLPEFKNAFSSSSPTATPPLQPDVKPRPSTFKVPQRRL